MKEEEDKLLDDYLAGLLSDEERQAVETRLQTDEAFAAELALRREMQAFLRQRERRTALAADLARLGDAHFSTTRSEAGIRRLPLWRRPLMVAAASVAVLAVVITVLSLLLRPNLYEQYAQHPLLSLTEMSGQGPDLSRIEQDFNSGDYQAAETGLERYLTQHPEDQMARLYLGIALLELDRYAEAADLFTAIQGSGSDLADTAVWYLALTYVKQKDRETARRYLQQIPAGSEWYEKAQRLLARL